MKATIKTILIAFLGLTIGLEICIAQNPIIQTIYTADPAPLVFNDTVYAYTGHDEDGSTWFTMKDWRVFSTTDMVNWTTHGSPLNFNMFSWAKGDAWAAQCIYRNGKFYWYICANHKTLNRMAIGVAVSDRPTGPFVDALGSPLVAANWGDIDPTVFLDDDGQAYLYWGNPDLWYVKLNEDMISYNQSVGVVKVPLTTESFGVRYNNAERATAYEEGPWLNKRNGLYYLLYAAGGIPENISYSTSTSPTGPWVYRDTIMKAQGGSFTNHCGVIDFKGNSYFFYHNGALSGGGGFTRSVCVEQFTYNADGSIPRFNMSSGIINSVGNLNPYIRNEAETMAVGSGIETENCSQGGINVYSIENGDYIKLRAVDFGATGVGTFAASVSSATNGGTIELRLNSATGTLIGTLPVNHTGGWDNWRTETTIISGVTGAKDLFLVFKGPANTALFKVDYWKFGTITISHDLVAINASVGNYKIDTVTGSNTTNLNVLAIFSDGTTEDITSLAVITPQQNGIIEISNGIIKGIKYSPVKIDISYLGKTDTVNMLIKDLKTEITAKSLSLDYDTFTLLTGATANVKVTVEYYDGHTEEVTAKATYTNPNSSVATVASNGKITGLSQGTAYVTVSFKGSLGTNVTAMLTIIVSFRDPYIKNEAEEFNAQSGIDTENCSDTGNGLNVGWIENGDWLRFNSLVFGTGAASFEARVSSAASGGNIEIRLDSPTGTLVGTCAVTVTGGWQTWVTTTCSITGLSGTHDIYLKFTGGSGFLFNMNWWKFNMANSIKQASMKCPINIVSVNNKQYLKGLSPGDLVTIYNNLGQVISSYKANAGSNEIKGNPGIKIIKIKTANQYYILKTVL